MTEIEKYPNLFKPIVLGKTIFRNRIFSAPTGLYDLSPHLSPSVDYISYFERKAKGGAASVNIGECYVDDVGKPLEYDVIRMKDHKYNYNGLAKLADSISRYGAVPTIELQKPGLASSDKEDDVLLGPSDGTNPFDPKALCRAMTEEEILQTIDDFSEAALYAKNRGFGMVTVHAGHGWLLHQFFSPLFNKRTDRWGGSVENRARFMVAVVDDIHRKCGKDFPVEIRISGTETVEGGYDIEDGIALAKQLDGHADLIHVSVGNIHAPHGSKYTHPGIFQDSACNVKYAAEIKKHVKTPVATIGGLSDPDELEEIIASGKADVVELARGLICEPDLAIKARTGRDKEIRRCLRCFTCVKQEYIHGRLFCAINPASGKDREISDAHPLKEHKNILIAGGGIAGMEAAITAHEEGHSVTICEKTDTLGGIILCESKVPFKKRIDEYIEHQKYMISKYGIEVRLNTEVTPEYVNEINPDVLIAALGATPVIPPIPGIDSDIVKRADEVFANPDLAGDSIVIVGAGLTGTELAIYLAQLGKNVSIIEMKIPDNAGNEFSETHDAKMLELGLQVQYGVAASRIESNGLMCTTAEGEKFIPADTIVLALGMKPRWDDAIALSQCAPEFYLVGDCKSPRDILAATGEGWTAAKNAGRY